MKVDEDFSALLGLIYQGPLQEPPWESFLARVRELLDAQLVTLVLRPPSDEEHVVMLADGGSLAAIESYNAGQFALDPFVNLPTGEVVALQDFISREALLASEFYQIIMEPQGWYDFLGVDLREENELDARFRVGRSRGARRFGEAEKQLIASLLPHLERSIRLYTRINRIEKERALYAGAVEQLSVATIILNEHGEVLSRNELATEILAQRDGLHCDNKRLRLSCRQGSDELQRLVDQVLAAQKRGDPLAVEALRVERPSSGPALALVIRGVPSAAVQGSSVPSVVIFISDPQRSSEAPVQIITRLFGFTPREATLALLLANGLTLDEASQSLGVSRNTTRTHLRALFVKTGVSRQTMLVRLILNSVAPLA